MADAEVSKTSDLGRVSSSLTSGTMRLSERPIGRFFFPWYC